MFAPLAIAAVLLAAPSSPEAVVKEGNAEVQKILASKPTPAKLEAAADAYVDFGELAKRALGKEWDKLNPKQQTEFSATMKGLLRASYAQKAIGQGAAAKTTYGKQKVTGNDAEVPTTIAVKKDTYPIVYKLYRTGEKGPWKIFDVVTDEVSLVETYRGQFRKIISEKGFDGLLTTLKNKRDQLEKQSADAGTPPP